MRLHSTPVARAENIPGDFDPHAITAMDKQTPPKPGADFNVVIVGAGNINFGAFALGPLISILYPVS